MTAIMIRITLRQTTSNDSQNSFIVLSTVRDIPDADAYWQRDWPRVRLNAPSAVLKGVLALTVIPSEGFSGFVSDIFT